MLDRRLLLKLFLTAAVVIISFTIHKQLKSSFETGLAIGFCFVILLSIWSNRVRKHRSFPGILYCYGFGTLFALLWVERGFSDLGTWISGTCFIFILIMLVRNMCLKAEPDEGEAD